MKQIWKIQSKITDTSLTKRRQQIINSLLKTRGLTTKSQQKEFFNPLSPENISLKQVGIHQTDLNKAIKRIKFAIKDNHPIFIYGDYDADGICSTAILWETLHALKANVLPHIPSREDKTRGLSQMGIDAILEKFKDQLSENILIITVDNGISSFKGCDYAAKKNIDIIITDHHQPKHEKNKPVLPKVEAIVHSTKIAGVGVAWFLAREILKKFKLTPRKSSLNTLELAALGTIADMVPLINANRSLAKFGTKELQQTRRPGLQILTKISNIDIKQIDSRQISFSLAPRINALGRLDHALDALRLLCTTDELRAKELANNLYQVNKTRQDLTQTALTHAKNQWLKQDQNQKLIFISHHSYHEGIVGLVAGRLADKFNKPAVVIAKGKNHSKGSVRSIKGFNVVKNLRTLEKHILELGGHELAAGFTIENKKMEIIQKKLQAMAKKQLSKKSPQPQLKIDCQINIEDINQELFNQLEKFQPFGFNNKRPVFATKQAKLTAFRAVGQTQKHLKLKIDNLDAIAFSFGDLASKLSLDKPVDIVYTIEENHWNGQTSLQLKVSEII